MSEPKIMRKARSISCGFIGALLLLCCAGSLADDLIRKLDAELPVLMREYNVPGLALAVIERTDAVTVRTYGVADRVTGRVVTADTLFNVGSVSKTFASWGALRLVAEGRADLDAPVEKYLTRWHLPASEFDSHQVTLRGLLSHTAGLSVHGYAGWVSLAQRPTLEESLSGVNNGAGPVRMIQRPGLGWDYSGGGYTLAQLAIEERTGQPFQTWFDQHVFPEMGLRGSHFTITPELLDRSSRAHDALGNPIPTRVFTELAAAGLSTTITDLASLGTLTLRRGVLANGKSFLPAPLFTAMITPQVSQMSEDRFAELPLLLGLERATDPRAQSYGLGHDIYKLSDQLTVVGHTGANIGWRAGLFVALEAGQGIAVVTNADGGRGVRDWIICTWGRHLRDVATACPKRAAPLLQIAYEKEGIDAVISGAKRMRGQRSSTDVSELTLLDVAYSIIDETPDDAQGNRRKADSLKLLHANLRLYPDSTATLIALASTYDQAGNRDRARTFARRALARDVTASERNELQNILSGQADP